MKNHEELLTKLLKAVDNFSIERDRSDVNEEKKAAYDQQADAIAEELINDGITIDEMRAFFENIEEELSEEERARSDKNARYCYQYCPAGARLYNVLMERAYQATMFDDKGAIELINHFIKDNEWSLKRNDRQYFRENAPKTLGVLLKKVLGSDSSIIFDLNLSALVCAYLFNMADDDLIALISDDPDEQKIQLQYTLGVMCNSEKRMSVDHRNDRIKTQAALLQCIKDKTFLTGVLRDFIIRSNDAGQVILSGANETIKLLIDAGADVNKTHMDESYSSRASQEFLKGHDGMSILCLLTRWGVSLNGLNFEVRSNEKRREMIRVTLENADVAINRDDVTALGHVVKLRGYISERFKGVQQLYLNELVRIIAIINNDKTEPNEKIKQEKRVNDLVRELVTHGLTVKDIPGLIKPIQDTLIKEGVKEQNWWPDKERIVSSSLREAQSRLYEKIFDNECREREKLLVKAKKTLRWGWFIVPLVIALGYYIAYRIKKYRGSTVVAFDMSFELFTEIPVQSGHTLRDFGSFYGRVDQKQIGTYPVHEKKKTKSMRCRKAIVFRRDIKDLKVDEEQAKQFKENKAIGNYEFAGLMPQTFFGVSHLADGASLKKDVRIYTTLFNGQAENFEKTLKHKVDLDGLDKQKASWVKV